MHNVFSHARVMAIGVISDLKSQLSFGIRYVVNNKYHFVMADTIINCRFICLHIYFLSLYRYMLLMRTAQQITTMLSAII